MERGVHDRGGLRTDERIDRREHALEDWEVLTDALAGALARRGLVNVDELRRGIESIPPEAYERASYYERWLFSIETILTAIHALCSVHRPPGTRAWRTARAPSRTHAGCSGSLAWRSATTSNCAWSTRPPISAIW